MVTYYESAISAFPYTNFIHKTQNEWHNHSFWEFSVILHGKSVNQIGNIRQELSSGSVILLRPMKETHRIKVISEDPEAYRHRDVYVSDEKMKRLCAVLSPDLYNELYATETPIFYEVSPVFLNYFEDIASLISDAQGKIEKTPLLETVHDAIVINLLTLYRTVKLNETLLPEWLNNFKAKLSSPNSFVYKVDELIKTVNFSHCHVCREFKKYVGVTVIRYFNEQKIRYASYLLMNTSLKIVDVSNAIGYSTPKNFIQQFKKQFSVSPSEWRLKNQIAFKK